MDKIWILIKAPKLQPRWQQIERADSFAMSEIVGGDIEALYPLPGDLDIMLVVTEGHGLNEFNFSVGDQRKAIGGTAFFCGDGGPEFTDLEEEAADQLCQHFNWECSSRPDAIAA